MHALTARALALLPAPLQSFCRHDSKYNDIAELVSECHAQLLAADADTDLLTVYKRARSACRRFTQDISHYASCYDSIDHSVPSPEPAEPTPDRRRDYVKRIAEERGVTLRRAQQIVKQMLADTERQQGLF
jgi:hypothetical protein